jgi:ATP-dependent Clp protease adaptor protein ClpS
MICPMRRLLASCQGAREAEHCVTPGSCAASDRKAAAAKNLLHAPLKEHFAGITWEGSKDRTDVAALTSIKSEHALSQAGRGPRRWPMRAGKEPKKPGDGGPGSGTALITRTRQQTRRPNMYRVLLLNDDYTTQEFVVIVLRKYFNKSVEEATRIMLHVHNHGVGECGVYTYEVAETKVTQVMDFARKHQHPLQCIMEKK